MELTNDMIMVMAIIAVAIFLFIVEWVRVDVVAIMIMVSLPLLGLVDPSQAFIGLSSNAVVSIIAVIIIGAGLDKTGVVNKVVNPVIRLAGESQNRIVAFISLTVATTSSFMQNIGAAALFLPAIRRISKTQKIPISRMLMPVGFSAILGGTITMVGSSPLIILNDLLPDDVEPFHLFYVTPIGIALLATGVTYFTFLHKYVLPMPDAISKTFTKGKDFDDHIKSWYYFLGDPYELAVPKNYSQDPQINFSKMRQKYLVNIVAVRWNDGNKTLSPSRERHLEGGMVIGFYGTLENVQKFAEEEQLELKKKLNVFEELLSPSLSGTIEAVVAPHSDMVGKSLGDTHFRKKFKISTMAIYRGSEVFKTNLSRITLQTGDALLFHGSWKRFKLLQDNHDFIFTTQVDLETLRTDKALYAAAALVIALTMVTFFKVQLSISLMTGALVVILSKVLSIDEAYQSVDWRTVFLLAGLIPLGMATQSTGTAEWVALKVLFIIGDVSQIVLLTIIGILATGLSLVISNVGATVLLVPLAIKMALVAGADPRLAALVVGIATSNTFILPTHQVNALYMGPGRYKSVDYIKAGSAFSVLFIFVMIFMMYLFYGANG